MGLFGLFSGVNINDGVKQYQESDGAVLLDVRTKAEYREGHIPGSVHLCVDSIDRIEGVVSDKETPLFVYCLSGARSAQACRFLKRFGYTNVTNIGGLSRYRGKLAK